MMKRIFIVCVILMISEVAVYAEDYAELRMRADDYWKQIQTITAKEFGAFNIELTLNTAYNFDETSRSGKGLGVGLSMPIYSKKERIANRVAAREFSEHGSDLLMKFRESIAHSEITSEECRVNETIMPEQGIEAAKAFFDCKRRLASQKLVTEQRERDIRSLLDPYLKKAEKVESVRY